MIYFVDICVEVDLVEVVLDYFGLAVDVIVLDYFGLAVALEVDVIVLDYFGLAVDVVA
jgi:hypothetical protein